MSALAGLALANVALTFGNLWPTLWIEPAWGLSVEVAALVAVLALVAKRLGAVPPRVVTGVAILFVMLAVGRYAEVTANELYGRPINLYYDVPHIPRVIAMFVEITPAWVVAAVIAGAILVVGAVFLLMRWAWGCVAGLLAVPRPRIALALVATGVFTAYPFAPAWFGEPVSADYARQATLLARALTGGRAKLGESPDFRGSFGNLGNADVFVIFVESYGAATYERPEYEKRLASGREALAAAVAQSGRGVVSAFVESPTFGGASWLAHASLLSGVEVREGDAYNLLLTQRRETLVDAFARCGYRTIALMPGLRQDWHEGAAFYGFDEVYGAARLDYRGPAFGWWRIPDQYALAKLGRLEAGRDLERPRFVFFPTISSHAPFRPTPAYESEWARLVSEEPYAGIAKEAKDPKAEWTHLDAAYGDAVSYALSWLGGYLRERAGDDVVFVVLGDHQPPAGVSGEKPSWNVPVHVIANRRGVLDALSASGFTPGLAPRAPAVGRMHELTPMLLNAFGTDVQTRVDVARPGAGG